MSKHAYVKAYPKEFRNHVVKLVQLGDRSPREVAREFGISVDSVRRWMKQAERGQGSRQDGLSSPEREELVRLRREIRRLRMGRERDQAPNERGGLSEPGAAEFAPEAGFHVGGRHGMHWPAARPASPSQAASASLSSSGVTPCIAASTRSKASKGPKPSSQPSSSPSASATGPSRTVRGRLAPEQWNARPTLVPRASSTRASRPSSSSSAGPHAKGRGGSGGGAARLAAVLAGGSPAGGILSLPP